MAQVFDRAMADPDATRVVLKSEDGTQRAVAVVEPGGLGVISLAASWPTSAPTAPTSCGASSTTRSSPSACSATDRWSNRSRSTATSPALVVTDEAAGGVPTSQQPALLKGTVA